MPEADVVEARRERNAALIEAMLLAAVADGHASDKKMEVLLSRVLERTEFEGTHADELNALVKASTQKLAAARDFEAVLRSLRDRLPDHKNRMLAFGLAAAVAFADQRATREELGLLKSFQAALGISEDEVARIIDVIEKGGSLAEALGEPLEQLYAEVMVLVTAADGKVREAEARELVESLAADPLFHDVSSARAQGFVSEAVAALEADGVSSRLRGLARGLSTHVQRLKAFRLAMRVANASGRPSVGELKLLDTLQATFGIADDEVERIRSELAG
jgi:tellurite resistance protein